MTAPAPTRTVRQYYEQNTRLFLLRSGHQRTRTIHRAVWAPEVNDLPEALNYTNKLIRTNLLDLAEQRPERTLRVADLGCGVGGSLFYLASHMPAAFWGVGLTISPQQAQLARRHTSELHLEERCAFVEADFQHLPLAEGLDAAFSIEAFAHAADAEGYIGEARRLLRRGGRLMLCDDFLTTEGGKDNPWLSAFREGWQVAGLSTAEQVVRLAEASGLELIYEQDLTGYLRLSAVPAWLAGAILGAGTRIKHVYWKSVTGGMALQQCLKQGLVSYRFLVFEKKTG